MLGEILEFEKEYNHGVRVSHIQYYGFAADWLNRNSECLGSIPSSATDFLHRLR